MKKVLVALLAVGLLASTTSCSSQKHYMKKHGLVQGCKSFKRPGH